MRMRVGVAIGGRDVRAVVTKASSIVWSGEEPYDESVVLEDALADCTQKRGRRRAAEGAASLTAFFP